MSEKGWFEDGVLYNPNLWLYFLELVLHRVECQNCGHLYWSSLPFMKGKRRMVRSFMTYALELLRFGTIKDVANHIGIGWDAVKEIHQEALEKKYATIPLSDLEYVGIDGFSINKRHKYMTVVSDLKTGKIIHAVEGRKGKDIEPFLNQLYGLLSYFKHRITNGIAEGINEFYSKKVIKI